LERAYHYSTYFFVVLSIEQQDTILKHQFEMEWPHLDLTWRVLLTFLLCNLLDNKIPLKKYKKSVWNEAPHRRRCHHRSGIRWWFGRKSGKNIETFKRSVYAFDHEVHLSPLQLRATFLMNVFSQLHLKLLWVNQCYQTFYVRNLRMFVIR